MPHPEIAIAFLTSINSLYAGYGSLYVTLCFVLLISMF